MGENEKVKNLRRLTSAMILAIMCWVLIFSSACYAVIDGAPASRYTEEEHIERVSERVEKKYIDTGKYEGYEVYPLYNANDELSHFLVEFKPSEFVYVMINTNGGVSCGCSTYGMYTQDYLCDYKNRQWYRYIIDENAEPTTVIEYDNRETKYTGRRFETDGDGNLIPYTDSHFKVANITDEKRYFLEVHQDGYPQYIPAVKRGDKFLNLVSMEEFVYDIRSKDIIYPTANNSFIVETEYDL